MAASVPGLRAHPLYTAMLETWSRNRDVFSGEEKIKKERTNYLPATSSMYADGFGKTGDQIGNKAYDAYLMRSYFPDIFSEAVESAVGVMHRKPAIIELPARMERLLTVATDQGEDLQLLLRRINAIQLTTGRLGLLGDLRIVDGLPQPILVVYNETAPYNWDDSVNAGESQDLRMVMVDESGYVLDNDLDWKWKKRTRVFGLVGPDMQLVKFDGDGSLPPGKYGSAVLTEDQSIQHAVFTVPNAQGMELGKVPFSFINSKDLSSNPDRPPLDGLASLCLAIYRGEADYRQNLFMQGQDTLVRIGTTGFGDDDDELTRVGAGARIDVAVGGDAKFIGVSGQGLGEQRQALDADYKRAQSKTSKLMISGGGAESGDALRIRVAAQTATLPQIAQAGAAALQTQLRNLAVWLGCDPEEVVVNPNLEFSDNQGNSQTLLQLVQAKIQGAPISAESVHAYMVEQGFTKMTFEEEQGFLDQEVPTV